MKKRISILMVITILMINIYVVPVYAETQNIINVKNSILEGYNELLRYAGLLIDSGIEAERSTLQFIKDRLVALGFFNDTPTDEEVQEFFDDNITVSPHSTSHHNITYSPDMVVFVENEIQSIMSTAPYFYAYSCNVKLRATDFESGDKYRAWNNFITQYQNEYYIFKVANYFYLYPLTNDIAFVYSTPRSQYAYVFGYDYNEWDQIKWSDMYKCFQYDDSSHSFTEVQSPHGNYAAGGFVIEDYNSIDASPVVDNSFQWIVSFGKNIVIKVYRTINDMKESNLGVSPYYITDSYNNFSNTSGSYNTTTADNSITYGDITNYINNYYGDNGIYPTPEDIKIYIDNNIHSGDGGGSSSSGQGATATATATTGNVTINNNINVGWSSSSGNNISQNEIDQGTNSIFGFISSIAKYLADLIKNVGSALAELIGALTSIITNITGNIPNLFSGIIEIVFSGLPDEIRAVILLGITLMVTYGIFKMIRG